MRDPQPTRFLALRPAVPVLAWLLASLFLVALASLSACAVEDRPASNDGPTSAASSPSSPRDASAPGPTGPKFCTQSRAEPLPARLTAMSTHASEGNEVVLVSELYDQFSANCGVCHGALNSMGAFQIATPGDFTLDIITKQNVLKHIESKEACPAPLNPQDPNEPMPPCGQPNAKLFSQRSPNDAVYTFAKLLEQWVMAKGPSSFIPTATGSGAAADGGAPPSQFAMTPATGNAMTNVGNCIPSVALVGVEESRSAALDAKFAAATAAPGDSPAKAIGLPENLSDTDLVTLDSESLAQEGVIAYAPGYPLWSDNAGKLRYVRVPRGQSIHFNKATQQFEIPANTRFYKTFMKLVADTDGSYRYRKIETRLIVARPDGTNPDGTAKQTALFGTYKWSDDESKATLFENLLYDGVPFPDDVFAYNTDEQLASAILATQPADPDEALLEGHAVRHYAIPSSQRCIQCHMGSPSQDFVLGFTPLQINRRQQGQGGTIEETGPDELSQLQRLIDYGVVTGIDSAADVLSLEQSQGSRSPRNAQELLAQGYLLGNCAHCHNPRGYPTSIQPLLADLLDFLPSSTTGGIFQFPLERESPDIFRGSTGNTHIPFITPSLMDLPRKDPATGNPAGDVFFGGLSSDANNAPTVTYTAFAPWRSLIYRNIQSAFTYEDDLALYPHMPMNTPGYDPRAKQIVSDWMVSIPAVRKSPDTPEFAFYDHNGTSFYDLNGAAQSGVNPDANQQPYVEVKPGDPRYAAAQAAAFQRLAVLHGAPVPGFATPLNIFIPYSDPGDTSDTVDPAVTLNPTCHPRPTNGAYATNGTFSTQELPYVEHPHWVKTDTTQLPGYTPRRQDWADILVREQTPAAPPTCDSNDNDLKSAYDDQVNVIALDQTATLDQPTSANGPTFREFATTKRPMALWTRKSGCNFSSQKTVGDYLAMPGAEGTHWMTTSTADRSAPVYEETPGAEVFKMICINCHGKRADGNGFIAQNLASLTGGLARVADFHDGLFGPAASPGTDIHATFGAQALPAGAPPNWTNVTDDDRAARYMAWMALGGTEVIIPSDVLNIVSVTPVFGTVRALQSKSANMLATAKALCASLLGNGKSFDRTKTYLDQALDTQLIFASGDAELWLKMCAASNPAPVHVMNYDGGSPILPFAFQGGAVNLSNMAKAGLVQPAYYLAHGGTTVGDENGHVVNLSPGTPGAPVPPEWPSWPFCYSISPGDTPPANLPICPADVSQLALTCLSTAMPGCFDQYDDSGANKWAVRGAMNAGFAVYLYLRSLETLASAPPDYNQCELLP